MFREGSFYISQTSGWSIWAFCWFIFRTELLLAFLTCQITRPAHPSTGNKNWKCSELNKLKKSFINFAPENFIVGIVEINYMKMLIKPIWTGDSEVGGEFARRLKREIHNKNLCASPLFRRWIIDLNFSCAPHFFSLASHKNSQRGNNDTFNSSEILLFEIKVRHPKLQHWQ